MAVFLIAGVVGTATADSAEEQLEQDAYEKIMGRARGSTVEFGMGEGKQKIGKNLIDTYRKKRETKVLVACIYWHGNSVKDLKTGTMWTSSNPFSGRFNLGDLRRGALNNCKSMAKGKGQDCKCQIVDENDKNKLKLPEDWAYAALLKRSEAAKVALAPPPKTPSPGAVRPAVGTYPTRPGETFRDCPDCPEMVVIPAGNFMMGSPASEAGRDADEGPRHRVTIPRAFALGKYEVTFAEWAACVQMDKCGHAPNDAAWGRGDRPVINVSWEDAKEYVLWLSRKTGEKYRLPSEAEWEYAARAGTTTPYWWGSSIGTGNANCAGCGSLWDNTRTARVGSFRPNRFGLHDMLGNVQEWVEDCWNGSYGGAPQDGSAWVSGDCNFRVLRGGAWDSGPNYLRSASRDRSATGGPYYYTVQGFRVARTLP